MPVRLIHSADLHIGRGFAKAPEHGERLREARLDVLDTLAEAARKAGVRRILLAGDVFDSTDPKQEVVRMARSRMERAAPIVWHIIPGNHDHARTGSVWHGFKPAPNIRVHLDAAPVPLDPAPGEPDAVLLPAPLLARGMAEDPTAWFDAAATPPDAIRIGLAHGAVRERKHGEATTLIATDRASRAGLDYLALGDWHGTLRIDDRAWYAGTPEPDQFDLAPGQRSLCRGGQALLVEIDAPGTAPRVTSLATGRYVWHSASEMVSSAADIEALIARYAGLHPDPRCLALLLSLAGTLPLSDSEAARAIITDRLGHIFWLVIQDRIEVEPTDDDLAEIDAPGGVVYAVAKQLAAMRADPAQGEVAARALARLWTWRDLARESGR